MKIKPFLVSILMLIISPCFLIINIIMIISLQQELFSQADSLIIEHITAEQGLSNPYILHFSEDRENYLWISTQGGIERYDGYNFVFYSHNPENANSIINAWTSDIYADKDGILWVGTYHGIEKFDRLTNTFTNYLPDSSKEGNKYDNFVYNIVEDKHGIFWVSTGKGVARFNKISGKFTWVQYQTADNQNIFGPLYIDKDSSLWYGSSLGLDKFNYRTGKFIHCWSDPKNQIKNWTSTSKYEISSICGGNNEVLWLGTTDGIIEFNKKSGTYSNYLINPNVHEAFSYNYIYSLCLGPSGILWVGSNKGLFSFDTKLKKFKHCYSDKGITTLYIDHSGALWASAWGAGMYKIILKKLPYRRYLPNDVYNIVKGNNGILWIEKSNQKWIKFNTRTELVTPVNFGDSRLILIDHSENMYFFSYSSGYFKKDKQGNITRFKGSKEPLEICLEAPGGIWYASMNRGLYFINFKTHYIMEVIKTEFPISSIYEDLSGLVWAGDMGKLYCYDQKKKTTTEFMSDPKEPTSISGRVVWAIYKDTEGRLWFATDIGLDRFIPSERTFIHFTEKDGLSGNVVYSILEDDHGNLWLGTNKGISKFNPGINQFKNYDLLQGLSSNYQNLNNLAFKLNNGEMFFGRTYGLIRFHPDSIKENSYIPPIVITSFRLFDKPVPFGKEIKLSYDKNFLSFEFAALSYYNSQRNQYAYKMEGVDKDWIYSSTRRYASYPNLSPGSYIFRVKGSNNDDVWNEAGTSISIIITPPWWKTSWAYISYGFIFILSLYGLRNYELNRVKLKNKIKLDEAILKEREETDVMKSRFFANISHELRTPLTLISGPIEKIISKSTDTNVLKDAGIVKRNSKRLLQLVNQLLDLSRLEAGKLKLEASKGNIVSFVKGIALSFESLSEEKDITLKIISEKEYMELYFDKEKMIKILSNILSNAFKFTAQNGKITVAINKKSSSSSVSSSSRASMQGFVEIKIRDTGIGIPEEEIPKLFDRFYQVDSSFTKEYEGTGIGLALTKELVELHQGNIRVESEMSKWTEFTIGLPLGKDHLKEEEILTEEKADKFESKIEEEKYSLHNNSNGDSRNGLDVNSQKEDKTIVLIVEDNYDMREYIKESLEGDYLVEEAVNGEQGVRKAENIIPDLIISDMMMPKMDGNELTRVLRNNEKTSHIPIIILTAKSGHEYKLEGLETGADEYLTKPFDIKELRIRITNLIKIRKGLQEKFGKGELIAKHEENEARVQKLRNIDEKFMNKVLKVVEEHISDENFSVEELGDIIGMSRSQVHRKISALTGKSPIIYIRTVRLLKAKKMIEVGEGNISEISYSVGFSSPVYFSKCFKEEFGYPPKNLIK